MIWPQVVLHCIVVYLVGKTGINNRRCNNEQISSTTAEMIVCVVYATHISFERVFAGKQNLSNEGVRRGI